MNRDIIIIIIINYYHYHHYFFANDKALPLSNSGFNFDKDKQIEHPGKDDKVVKESHTELSIRNPFFQQKTSFFFSASAKCKSTMNIPTPQICVSNLVNEPQLSK